MTHTHFTDPTGLSSENVVDGATTWRCMVQRGRRLSADPRIHDDARATTSKCSRPAAMLGFNNTNALVKSGQWDIQLQQDRLHPRGRQMPGDAGQHRQPADGDRAARFARQATRASAMPIASSTGSKPARRCRPPVAAATRQAVKDQGSCQGGAPIASQGQGAPRCVSARTLASTAAIAALFHCQVRASALRAALRQQFLGVRARLGGDFVAPQHSRQLLDALGCASSCASSVATCSPLPRLAHAIVLVGAGRHLRQVRDAQHLPPRPSCCSSGRPSRRPRRRCRRRLRRRSASAPRRLRLATTWIASASARQLAARRDARQRTQRLLRMGRDAEFDALEAVARGLGQRRSARPRSGRRPSPAPASSR